MTRGVFIAGTDTGIGKTLVSAGILRWLRAQHIDAVPMKPVQTGAEKHGDIMVAPDLEYCLAAAGLQPDHDEKRRMCPYLYEPACSPHLAGRLAGRYPDLSVVQNSAEILLRRHQALIVEGAGGVMVPLNERETMLDLIKLLELPVVLVSRVGLGSINHALLSVRALRTAGVPIAGIVFNRTAPPVPADRFIEEDNPDAIARFGDVIILGSIPYLGTGPVGNDTWRQFEKSMPGLDWIRDTLGLNH